LKGEGGGSGSRWQSGVEFNMNEGREQMQFPVKIFRARILTVWLLVLAVLTLTLPYKVLADVACTVTQAQGATVVKVDPPLIEYNTNATGQQFTIAVKIADVTNLYGFDIKLGWNTTFLEHVSHSVRVPKDTYPDGVLWNPIIPPIEDEVNASAGTYWVAYASRWPAPSFNGSGTAFTITFKVKYHPAQYTANITLELYSTDLAFPDASPIPHTRENGAVILYALATVAISPSSLAGPPGWIGINNTFTVNLTISGVTDLVYWQAGLSFNPTVLQCVDFVEGPFLQAGGDTVWQPGVIDNDAGLISPYGCTLTAEGEGSGNGTLAFLTFKVRATGASSLILGNVILLDSDYDKIEPITLRNGYFELPSAVPEPPSAYFYYYPRVPYVNEIIVFNASDSTPNGGNITSYEWVFGDSTQGQGVVVNHTYTDPGEYNVTLIVTDYENLTGDFSGIVTILPLPLGASIDVYSQRGGNGLDKPSDAFAPDECVIITAYYTYNGAPVAGKLITFNLYLPNGTNILSRVIETDDNGLAFTSFSIQQEPVFGLYSLNASTPFGGQMVSDSLSFRVGWLVELLDAVPCNSHGVPKIAFGLEEPLYFTVKVQNIRFHSAKATLTVTVLGETQQPILFAAGEYVLPPNQTILLLNMGRVPKGALVGTATAYVNAFQGLGGSPPYCPEVLAALAIVRPIPDVALVGVTASPSEVCVGQCVMITLTVLNDCNKPQSFNVTIYANSTAIQTLTIVDLDPYVEACFTCTWDTYPFSPANYLISAQASIVPGETDTADNTFVDDVVRVLPRTSPVHDVAVTDIHPHKTVVAHEHLLVVDATIQNQGDYTENFNLTLYANATIIDTFTSITLTNGSSAIITFTWNTSNYAFGKYITSAYAWPVPYETDTIDNTLSTSVTVTIPGDINGDQYVNAKDAVILGGAFGAKRGDPLYSPNADINDDEYVNAKDAVILGTYFGQHWT